MWYNRHFSTTFDDIVNWDCYITALIKLRLNMGIVSKRQIYTRSTYCSKEYDKLVRVVVERDIKRVLNFLSQFV